MESKQVAFQRAGDMFLATLPPAIEHNIEILRSARIVAAGDNEDAFLITDSETYQMRWLLSSNQMFLLDEDCQAVQLFEKQIELTRVKPDFSQFYVNRDLVAASPAEMIEFERMCFPLAVPSVSQVAQAIIRLKCIEASNEQVIEELQDFFGQKFEFSRQIDWLCAIADGKPHQYPAALQHGAYLQFGARQLVQAIIQDFCAQKRVFLMQHLMQFYEKLNIPTSLSLEATSLQQEEVIADGRLSNTFYLHFISFQQGQLWGCTYDQRLSESTILRYYQRDTLPYDLKQRAYRLFDGCEQLRFTELLSACSDCSMDAAKELKHLVWEEDRDGDVWCGCRPYYSFLQ